MGGSRTLSSGFTWHTAQQSKGITLRMIRAAISMEAASIVRYAQPPKSLHKNILDSKFDRRTWDPLISREG